MTNKEKLIAEVQRVKSVLEAVELGGENMRAAMIQYKLKEAERVLWWESERGIAQSLKELEGIV